MDIYKNGLEFGKIKTMQFCVPIFKIQILKMKISEGEKDFQNIFFSFRSSR